MPNKKTGTIKKAIENKFILCSKIINYHLSLEICQSKSESRMNLKSSKTRDCEYSIWKILFMYKSFNFDIFDDPEQKF